MLISRRQFLKYCTVAAGALGLSATDLIKLDKALALEDGLPIIWINAATCSGCSTSLLNSVYYATIQEILLSGGANQTLDIEFHPTVMAAEGEAAISNALTRINAVGGYILVVEGSIQAGKPYSSNTGSGATSGDFCHIGDFGTIGSTVCGKTAMGVIDYLAQHSIYNLAVGTCASYGGIPAAEGSITGAYGLMDYFAIKYPGTRGGSTVPTSGETYYSAQWHSVRNRTINIPGCPPNPNWIIGTIAYIMAHSLALPPMDSLRKPRMYYGERICNSCNRFLGTETGSTWGLTYHGLAGNFINNNTPDDIGNDDMRTYCLKYIGCKGSRTKSDCSLRKWQSPGYGTTGINWCVGAGAPCQGCTQDVFPDGMSPFLYIR